MSLHEQELQAASRMRALERLEEKAFDDLPMATLRPLEDVVEERRVKLRDCRDCKNFNRDESGLNFGWCDAHQQFVKLYHPASEWFSQCIFKGLRRYKPQELERAVTAHKLQVGATNDTLLADDGLEPSLEDVA